MKPGPKPLLGTTMTQAERQARYRASLAQATPRDRVTANPLTAAVGHSGGAMRWRNRWRYRTTIRRGSTLYPKIS